MYPDCFLELYRASGGEDLGLSFVDFAPCLLAIGRDELGPAAGLPETVTFCKKLHLKDLALAQACSGGNPAAWEIFIQRYRARLYAAALVLTRDDSAACELADSISGDLFGCAAAPGESHGSKLASYTGRGSLDNWLKAVLTHAYVDRYRSERRIVSLDSRLDSLKSLWTSNAREPATADPRLNDAIKESFLRCDPEGRFLLAAYFFDDRTLAEIATMLGVHESTVSRRMNRTLRELRNDIRRGLRKRGMTARQIEESLQSDVRSLSLDVRRHLIPGINMVGE